MCRKIRITRCENSRFYLELAKIEIIYIINLDKPKIVIKNIRNHLYHQFHPVLVNIQVNQDLLYYRMGSMLISFVSYVVSVSSPFTKKHVHVLKKLLLLFEKDYAIMRKYASQALM